MKTLLGAGFHGIAIPKVRFANPDASRARSSELYLLASGFRMV
jgi:hypothetical protein